MQSVNLNMIPGSVMPVVNVTQFDEGREFGLVILNGTSAASLSGATFKINGRKQDDKGFSYDQTEQVKGQYVISVSGNVVTIRTTIQMTAVKGDTLTTLEIMFSTQDICTLNFILRCQENPLADVDISETDIPAIIDAGEQAAERAETAAQNASDSADAASRSEISAGSSADDAAADALKAEGFAVGEQNGQAVESGSPYYHNNAEYFKNEAGTSATNAGNSETNAAADALKAEGWAVGKQNGTDVTSGSPYYHDNASYWADQAAQSAAEAEQYAQGGLIYKGSIAFADIPTSGMKAGHMYNMNEDFTTDSRFQEGAGIEVKAGTDIAWNGLKWDLLAVGADSLDDLTDVDITSAADGELLQYDANGQKWKNSAEIPQKVDDLQDQIDEIRGRLPQIYGAVWDGSADTSWTRTYDAASFADPQPYYAGMSGTPSSPFDNIQPWAGMVKSEDANAGTVVAIPKFYYKMGYASGTTGLKIQIAPAANGADWAAANGFKVSPAHMDRGDGAGERDVVYIGRYHCASDYKSKTGVTPKVSTTRATFRSGIHNLGSNVWQNDYAMRVTIWMLYLVEFADWDSQNKIGGGENDTTFPRSAVFNMGYTDSMTYHTGTVGTTISSTDAYGTQYRNIEGLWDNCCDWVEGQRFNGTSIYGILNPAEFSDSANGVLVGTKLTVAEGHIKAYTMPTVSGYEWMLIPSDADGSSTTYVTDYCQYMSPGTVLRMGAYYGPADGGKGMFLINYYYNYSQSHGHTGSRLMVLP